MLRGINRSVIVVRGNAKSRFETVYFVIKKGLGSDRRDLADEAQRIIGESGLAGAKRSKRLTKSAMFLLGAAVGIFLSSIVGLTLAFSL